MCLCVCVWNGIDPLWTVKPQMMREFHMEATESKLCLYHAPCPGVVASQDEGLSSKLGRRGLSPAQGRRGWVAMMQIKTGPFSTGSTWSLFSYLFLLYSWSSGESWGWFLCGWELGWNLVGSCWPTRQWRLEAGRNEGFLSVYFFPWPPDGNTSLETEPEPQDSAQDGYYSEDFQLPCIIWRGSWHPISYLFDQILLSAYYVPSPVGVGWRVRVPQRTGPYKIHQGYSFHSSYSLARETEVRQIITKQWTHFICSMNSFQ